MRKRWFPVVAASAILMMLTSAGVSRAQFGGFWGGWGTMSPWSGTGGAMYWPGGIGANYIPGIYNRGGYGGMGYGAMGMGMGYGAMGGMMGSGMYPGYPYGFLPTSLATSPMAYVAYSPPVFTTTAPVVAPTAGLLPANQPATIEVLVPTDAVVRFDGHATQQTGEYRLFTTPPLIKGDSYHYEVEAAFLQDGKKVTQKQRVPVYAGGRATAVFPMKK
jgi:uncharacterized protein (TIGR03000 family)